jgi:hypothetical protein
MITSGAAVAHAYVGGTCSFTGRFTPPNVVVAQAGRGPPVPLLLALLLLVAVTSPPVLAVDEALLLPPPFPPVPPVG